jgi:hypothetical protein
MRMQRKERYGGSLNSKGLWRRSTPEAAISLEKLERGRERFTE